MNEPNMDNFWNAVSAIGQCLGAIATFLAVHVALKPYKRKLDIKFVLLNADLVKETHTIPICIEFINKGLREIEITAYGVEDDSISIEIDRTSFVLGDGQRCYRPIDFPKLNEALSFLNKSKLRIWALDNGQNRYCSKRYKAKHFTIGSLITSSDNKMSK